MDYQPPVSELLKLGDVRGTVKWHDYLALGLGPEAVPELIRMAGDAALHEADGESTEVWAPVHAWRALGQLRAEAAVEPLLGLLHRIDDEDDDAVGEEVPKVLGMLGPAALVPAADYLIDPKHGLYARVAASQAVKEIGQRFPEAREAAVANLMRALARFGELGRDETLNGFLVSDLMDLKAVEAAGLMERAFVADAVDTMITGEWKQVAAELGLALPETPPAASASVGEKKKKKRSRKKRSGGSG
jgi:HEAT repeat protein